MGQLARPTATAPQNLAWVRRAKRAGREAERAQAREEARQALGDLPDNIVLAHADCREYTWPEQVDLIVADPPWTDLAHYEWLASWAGGHLREGGLALVQASHHLLPEVMSSLGASLTYIWTMSLVYSESRTMVANGRFRTAWRPVLLYGRGEVSFPESLSDTYQLHGLGTEKKYHAWEQPVAPWRYWLSRLARPGQLVADPFAGGGTVAVVCQELGLRYVGTEVDRETFRVARGRISTASEG